MGPYHGVERGRRVDDAVLEFLFGCDADVAQHRAGELGEETLHEIEPGTMLGCEDEFEAADRLFGNPSIGLLSLETWAE